MKNYAAKRFFEHYRESKKVYNNLRTRQDRIKHLIRAIPRSTKRELQDYERLYISDYVELKTAIRGADIVCRYWKKAYRGALNNYEE